MSEFYKDIRFPRWLNAEHTLIECEVNFRHVTFEEWTVFCANPNDYMPYSRDIFDRCANGEFGPVAEYIAPPPADSNGTIIFNPPAGSIPGVIL